MYARYEDQGTSSVCFLLPLPLFSGKLIDFAAEIAEFVVKYQSKVKAI